MMPAPEVELMRLLKFGTPRKIRELISSNPSMDLHYPSVDLSTPLTTAIERSDPAVLTMLIDKLAGNLDATLTQPCGKTALMHAAYYTRNPEVLHVLIKKGADPRKTDVNGWNCLFYAVIGRRLQNVNALLDCQVSIESRDCEGRTPLMVSVYLSTPEIFVQLLDRGAAADARDRHGLSSFQLAIVRRRRECVIELSRRCSVDPEHIGIRNLVRELMSDVLPTRTDYHDDRECEVEEEVTARVI